MKRTILMFTLAFPLLTACQSDDEPAPSCREVCNGVDDDGNGIVDDNPADGYEFYYDKDGDGYGDVHDTAYSCDTKPLPGTVLNDDDCDDTDPNRNVEGCTPN